MVHHRIRCSHTVTLWSSFSCFSGIVNISDRKNLIYIRDLLGHTSVVTTEIYAKTNPKIKEEQLRKHGAAVETPDRYSKEKRKI